MTGWDHHIVVNDGDEVGGGSPFAMYPITSPKTVRSAEGGVIPNQLSVAAKQVAVHYCARPPKLKPPPSVDGEIALRERRTGTEWRPSESSGAGTRFEPPLVERAAQ